MLLLLLHWDRLLGNPCVSSDSMWSFKWIDFRQDPDPPVWILAHIFHGLRYKIGWCVQVHILWPEPDFNRDFTTFHQMTPRQGQDSRNSTCRVFDSQTWAPDSDPSISDSNVIVSAYLYCLALLRLFLVGGFESILLLSPFLVSNCNVAQALAPATTKSKNIPTDPWNIP